MYIVAEGSSDMAEKKRDYSLNASLYSRPRKTAAEIAELKKRANKRKMLEAQMEGARELGKHWGGYIKKTERKRKATKVIKTAAEIAELAAGVPAIGKAVGKKVIKEAAKKAAKNAIKITPESKFARRTVAAKAKEIVKGAAKGKPTPKGTPKKPDVGRSRPKGLTDRQWENLQRGRKRVERIKKSPWMQRAVKTNKAQKNTPASPIRNPKIKGKKDPFAALKGLDKKSAMKAIQGKIDQAKKKLEKLGVPKKDWPKKPTAKPKPKPKPKRHTWKDPDLQYMVNEINRKRKLPTRIEPWEITGKGKKLSPEELKKWNKKARNTPLPKRKKPGSGGKGRK
jgi:hypothetical protein